MFGIILQKIIQHIELRRVKDVDLGLQNTMGSANSVPGYAYNYIQGSPIEHVLSGLNRRPQAWLICVPEGEVLRGKIAWARSKPTNFL